MTALIIGMGVAEGKVEAATKGTYQYNDSFSSVYEGELNEEGLPNGKGETFYIDETGQKKLIYKGEYKSGKYDGKGTLYIHTISNEPTISGVFVDGNPPARFPYENEFYLIDGKVEFMGNPSKIKTGKKMVVYYQHGNVYYEGSWKNNNINGKGITYHDYHEKTPLKKGKFKNGVLLGNGKVYFENGQLQYKGKFKEEGLLHGYGLSGNATEYYESGQIKYKGQFKGSNYDGKGKYYYENGELAYEGEWKAGNPNGKGKKYYENGELSYNGKWKAGKFNGKGTLYNENGEVIQKGTFDNGQFVD
jgi:antitoxin component YwqK of YwqJK toxin-antitoxin module